ncbi:MAG TPA: hypothetical protein DCQ98_11040 [Planctomycetaceae bacterium]|nr:hypothetical protein [Planctomycetaceae bacterium]HRE99022.1 ubiquitin-conjugating enzyme E2 [Pirellulaceae bacterium]
MTTESSERRAAEVRGLEALARESSILSYSPDADPPSRIRLVFRGGGWAPDERSGGRPRRVESHEVEIVFPYEYPTVPPEVRFLTPVFHPSVSSAGTVALDDLGLNWEPGLESDVLCERLWDLLRGAYLPTGVDRQEGARRWFDAAPVAARVADPRPLRDTPDTPPRNIIRYARRTTVYAVPEGRSRRERRSAERHVGAPTVADARGARTEGGRVEPPPIIARPSIPSRPVARNDDPGIVFLGERRTASARESLPAVDDVTNGLPSPAPFPPRSSRPEDPPANGIVFLDDRT